MAQTLKKQQDNGECNQALVEMTKEYMLSEDQLSSLSETFRIFSDDTRLKIIFALLKSELSVNDIAAALDMSQSSISHQLRTLKNAKLVKAVRDGKSIIYSLDDNHVRLIIDQAIAHILHN